MIESTKSPPPKIDHLLTCFQTTDVLPFPSPTGQSGGSDTFGTGQHASPNPGCSQSAPDPIVLSAEHVEQKAVRQPSTTEYLPGMLHSDSPLGLLPMFSSWSLLSLGKYSSYNPSHGEFRNGSGETWVNNHLKSVPAKCGQAVKLGPGIKAGHILWCAGLDQPGFLHGGNHLLPWDVVVKGDRDKWPTVGETSGGKKGKHKKVQQKPGTMQVIMHVWGLMQNCVLVVRLFRKSILVGLSQVGLPWQTDSDQHTFNDLHVLHVWIGGGPL